MTSDLIQQLKEEMSQLEGKDPALLALESELAGEDELKWLAEIMTLPHWFDLPMLEYMIPQDWKPDLEMDFIGQPFDYGAALLKLSFVSRLPVATGQEKELVRYGYNRSSHTLLLKRWQAPDRREELLIFSRRFRKYFHQRARKAEEFEQPLLEREALYHLFIIDERKALEQFQVLFEDAQSYYQFGTCQALLNLAREQEPFFKRANTKDWLLYFQGRLHLLLDERQDARHCFESIICQPKLQTGLVGRAFAGIGDIWASEGNWVKAIQAYEKSLDVLLNLRMYQLYNWYIDLIRKTKILSLRLPTVSDFILGSFQSISGTLVKRNEIRKKALKSPERQEGARILAKMAEIALAMSQRPLHIADFNPPFRGDLLLHSSEYHDQGALSKVIFRRLQDFSFQYFELALSLLEKPSCSSSQHQTDLSQNGEPQPKVIKSRLLESLRRDIRFGLATVLRLRGKKEQARELLNNLLAEETRNRTRAELTIALGDCEITEIGWVSKAEKYFLEAVEILKDTWDEALYATALSRLGFINALQERWEEALSNLISSREIFSKLNLFREEEKVQEILREIERLPDEKESESSSAKARAEKIPEEIRKSVKSNIKGWPISYFAYPASFQVLNRVKSIWFPVLLITSLILSIPFFTFMRLLGTKVLGVVGIHDPFSPILANVFLFIFSFFSMLFFVDMLPFIRSAIGKFLSLDSFIGTQPGLIGVDGTYLTKYDFTGEVRRIAWDDIKEIRHAFSKNWEKGDSTLTTSDAPGGATQIISEIGSLYFDSWINSYSELENFVQNRVPINKYKQLNIKDYGRGSVFSMIWGLSCLSVLCGCPILFILTSAHQSWWMTLLKIIAWFYAVIFWIGFPVGIILQLLEARKLRRFLYPSDLPGPPPAEEKSSF